MLLECAASALCLAAARWLWRDTVSFRRRGLAGRQPPRREPDEEPAPYVAVRPNRPERKKPEPKPDMVQP